MISLYTGRPFGFYRLMLTFFFVLNFSLLAISQNKQQVGAIISNYDLTKLTDLSKQYSQQYAREKLEADAYAYRNNIPIKKYYPDGSFDELKKIAEDGTPIYFSLNNVNAAISTRANYLNTGGGLGLNVNGDNLTAYVWDGGPVRLTHQEFDGPGGNNRVTINDGVTGLNGNSFHSQHVTGTIVASGFVAASKGMAWQGNARTNEWNNDLAEATAAAANGMLISNHSYGYQAASIPDQWFGAYREDARDWDNLMYNAPYYLMVNSAGNDGANNTANGAPLDGQVAFDKLNGTSTSKNNMVVANGNDAIINPDGSLNSVSRNASSSEGPTDDYRIKPDIMGNGTNLYSCLQTSDNAYGNLTGTSMSSPNVAGTLLLLQEHFNNLNGQFMKAATLKGLALHTSDDVAANGPDAETGWGLMNAKKAAEAITAASAGGNAVISELTLNQGQTYQVTIQADGVNPLYASISWTDPASVVNNGTNSHTPALVNDLDLRLNNGTTYSPWKLTGVTTNATGDNIVDPYEKIEINGASGQYVLTVNHKGTLSSGLQNFSLIVTGGSIVAATPEISFGTTTASTDELTDCNYTDITVPLNIAQPPSEDADVIFTVAGGTATNGEDFQLMTTSVTFLQGQTTSQNMTVRIYHDGFIESTETVIIDFTVDAHGGDASANINADSLTITINDDDFAPTISEDVILLNEDFEVNSWASLDGDGDGRGWIGLTGLSYTGITGNFPGSETNLSLLGGSGKANANNYLISPQISIPPDATNTRFIFGIGGYNTLEHYAVYWTTNIANAAAINAGIQLEVGNSPSNTGEIRTINNTTLAGQTGYFVVRHFNSSANNGVLLFDNASITVTIPSKVQTAVNNGTTNDLVHLPGAGSMYNSDSASQKIMLNVINNESYDYGCTDVSVSRAGTSAQPYNGSIFPNLVMDKNFRISVDQPKMGGDTSIKFYFTEAEIAGWESATNLTRDQLVVFREGINEISPLIIGSFGSNVTLTGDFTGLEGDFIFGPATAFSTCPTTEYIAGSWSNGTPDISKAAIIKDNYDTSVLGSIDACSLIVDANKTLTVGAGDYVKVGGDITINGNLFVAHEGSVVQVNDAATVTNNGSITVRKTTPFLESKFFMVLGSPMSAETRENVYSSAFQVRHHLTANFVPDLDVENGDPLAENFADDNGDNWVHHTGALNPGEGYLVFPQPSPTSSGTYTHDYTLGTLNNGEIDFNVLYNGTQNASPNIVGNPYASAIDADQFLSENTMVDALYFWEHITPPINTYPGYYTNNYDMGDISMYNSSGGVPAANDLVGTTTPNGYIASGQGFGFKATAAGTAVFKNDMRVTDNNDTYQKPSLERNRIWLHISNEKYELRSTMLVSFSEASLDGFDAQYDAKRMATPVSLYSKLETGEELAIQGRSPFNANQAVALGFVSQVEEDDRI